MANEYVMLQRVGAILVLAIAVLALTQPTLPVQPSYATSGSMSPTIDVGELYFVVQSDDAAVGDVITFYSEQRDQYITHRVVDRTPEGFITRGDDNPSTDQAGGFPPVDRSNLLGKVLEVNGKPLTIGGFGAIASRLQAFRIPLLILAGLLIFAPTVLPGGTGRLPDREVMRIGEVLRPMFVGAVLVCLVLLVVGASSHDLVYVATDSGVGPQHVVPVGEAVEKTVVVETWVPPLTTAIIDADGVSVIDKRVVEDGVELTHRVPARASKGPYEATVTVHPYPAILPESVLARLDAVSWPLTIVASILPVFLPLLTVYLLVIDGSALVRPPRSRWLHRRSD